MNNPKADKPYFRDYLKRYGCQTARLVNKQLKNSTTPWKGKLYKVGAYRIPTLNGYKIIYHLLIGDHGYYTVKNQLSGECPTWHAK